MKSISGGVCDPKGFLASGINCGIKKKKKDLALIYSKKPCVACGLFTANTFKAAAIQVSKRHLSNAQAQAIVVNSGNANCFTGAYGLVYTQKLALGCARKLSLDKQDVLVASTGIIGRAFPIERIDKNRRKLVSSVCDGGSVAGG